VCVGCLSRSSHGRHGQVLWLVRFSDDDDDDDSDDDDDDDDDDDRNDGDDMVPVFRMPSKEQP
jgi:hypothetical protein